MTTDKGKMEAVFLLNS